MTSNAAILRIRPDSQKAVGHRRETLHRIAEAVLSEATSESGAQGSVATRTISFPTGAQGPADAATFQEDLEWVTKAHIVIIDIAFSMNRVRRGVVDPLLADTLRLLLHFCTDEHRVVLLVEDFNVALPTDDLGKVLGEHVVAKHVAVIATDQSAPRPATAWGLPVGIEGLCVFTTADRINLLHDRILRRRGVFTSPREGEYLAFHYSPHANSDVLVDIVAEKIRRLSPGVVLFDGSPDEWLGRTVLAAANREGVYGGNVDDLFNEERAGQSEIGEVRGLLQEVITHSGTSVLVVVPLIKSGRAMATLVERMRGAFRGKLRILAVFVDETFAGARTDPITQQVGRESIEIHFVLKVRQALLPATDWRVRAAEAGGFIEELRAPWDEPSPVALWSLYADVGVGPEVPVPPRRNGVRWFPQLRAMAPWDAVWLGECLVRRARRELSTAVEELVFIVPDEESGARPLAEALREWLDVTVVTIEREKIGAPLSNTSFSEQLTRYPGHRLVIADESTVTYDTIKRIEALVREAVNRAPDLAVVALELPLSTAERPPYLRALHSWRPTATIERVEGGE